jgi:hypothetical protein
MATDEEGLNNSDILKALGLKLPNTQANPLRDLWNTLEDVEDFSDFESKINNISSFAEFEDYLINDLGYTAEDAEDFRLQVEQKYSSFSDFQTFIVDEADSYEDWENSLSWGETVGGNTTDEDGRLVAGFRFHDSAGVTKDGVSVPAGSTEVFGNEVHFSQSGASRSSDDSTSDTGDGDLFSFSNLTGDEVGVRAQTLTYTVDLTSNSDYQENFLPVLKVDGEVVREGDLISIGANSTRSISLSTAFSTEGTYEVGFNKGPTLTVTIDPATVGL